MKEKYINCSCSSLEHICRLTYYSDEPDFLYFTVHLNNLSFWKRLILGIKYIFGYQSKYGCVEEIMLKTDECFDMINFMNEYCVTYEKWVHQEKK